MVASVSTMVCSSAPIERSCIDWDLVPLGRWSDEVLSRRLGVSRQAVAAQRRHRGIAAARSTMRPIVGPLSGLERRDLADLERALDRILDASHPLLTVAVASAVALTPGWLVEHRLRDPSAPPSSRLRLSFRFRPFGRRSFGEWLQPKPAREWLLRAGWVDAAAARIEELSRAAEVGRA